MGYSYDYGYDYGYGYAGPDEAMMEEMMMEMMGSVGLVVGVVVAVIALFALAVAITTYVFRSLGLYAIAKRRGIRNPWMVWFPILGDWIVGSISDQYQYVVKGKVRSKRLVLVLASIAIIMCSIAANVISFYNGMLGGLEEVFTILGVVMLIANVLTSIVYTVFYYVAMYDLYTSCSPQNNVMFLVLSIVFRITEPFFIFFNRKKDGGMPPRREVPAAPVLQEPAPQENWDVPDYL